MRVALAIVVLAGGSVLWADPAPAYDPWAWLLWGREVTEGALSTAEGPAFKPLPVALTALLAPLGGAAPWLWVLLARAGTAAALVLAWRRAGLLGAVAVFLTGELAGLTASGHSEGLLLALALGAWELWERDRRAAALVLGLLAALIRVEALPFVLAAAVVAWRRGGVDGRWLAAGAIAVPLLWFVPEYLGSGDLLRSSDRARVPNPGQPALAAFPLGASLREAVALVPWPLWLGVAHALARRRDTLAPAAAGAAWIALVALMSQFGGFSGEPRYALPGAALIALTAAWAAKRVPRTRNAAQRWLAPAPPSSPMSAWAAKRVPRTRNAAQRWLAPALLVAIVVLEGPKLADVRDAQAYQWNLQRDLTEAVERVDVCGTPYTGPLRGPLTAYRLHVHKDEVEPDAPPRPPGTVFQSRLTPDAPLEPSAPGFEEAATAGLWTVRVRCP